MSRLIFEARRRLPLAGDPQGHHHHRGAAGAAPGDPAVVARAGAAGGDRDPDRRHDRRDGRHRDAADLAADTVLPVRAAAGGHRVVPRSTTRRVPKRSTPSAPTTCATCRWSGTTSARRPPRSAPLPQWSHPEPADLAAVPGSRRQWERDPHDGDFLVVRAGVHSAAWPPPCGSTTPPTRSTWNRCRTAHYAACWTPSAPCATCRPGST